MLYNNGESEVNTLFLWNKKEDDTDYRIKFVRWLIITSVATLICLVLQLCHIMYFPWLFVFSPTILFVFWYAGVSLRYGLEHFENINIWMNGDSIFVILTIVFFITESVISPHTHVVFGKLCLNVSIALGSKSSATSVVKPST